MASTEKKEGQGPSDEKCRYYIKFIEENKEMISEQFEEVFDEWVTDIMDSLNQNSLDLMNEFISEITKDKEDKHMAYKWLLKIFKEEFKCKLQNATGDVKDVLKCLSEEECSRLNTAEEEFGTEELFKILDERLDERKHLVYERFVCAMLMLDLDRNLPVLITEIRDPDPLIETLGLTNKSEEESDVKVVNIYSHLRKNLIAGRIKTYNKFLFKLGDLYPYVFENLVGKEPDNEYLKHHVEDTILKMSKRILEQPFQADKEMDETISGDNYVSLSIGEFNFGSNRSNIPSGWKGGRPRMSAYRFRPDKNPSSEKLKSDKQPKIVNLTKDQTSFIGEDSNLEDLLNKSKDRYRRVLIQGRCGVGKTTMIQNMAYKWAQGESLQDFYFFFVIKIRSLDKEESLYELLTENSLYPSEIEEKWLISYPHRIFICIDGLDEMNMFSDSMRNDAKICDLNKKDSGRKIVINLLRRNLLPKATVVATTRPFIGLDELKPDLNLEIKGLTQERIIEFISKNVDKTRQESVKKSLRESPTLLSLCNFPYYASKVTKDLSEHPDQDFSEVNTYSELHAFMILNHYERQTTDFSKQKQFNESLPALAAIAAHIFHRGSQNENNFGMCFDMDDTFQLGKYEGGAGEAVNQGEKYGLIQTTRVKTGQGSRRLVKFNHLSVQEMLAAVHFLKQSDENIDDLRNAVSKLTDSQSLEMMQIFLFAVVFDKASRNLKRLKWYITGSLEVSKQKKDVLFEIFEKLLAKISEDERHLLKLCLLSYETKNDELAKKVSSAIKSKGLCMKDISLNAIDVKALIFVLEDAHLEEITLENTNLSDYSCQLLLESLETHEEITAIKLTDNKIEQQETLSCVSNLLMLKNLRLIDLSRNSISDECFEGLLPGLQQEDGQSISLNIEGNSLSAQCLTSFLASPSCNIISLDIGYLDSTQGRFDCCHLAKALSVNRTLESLYLPGNSIGVEGAKALASAIKKMDSLQSLGIGNNNITDDGAVEIARALKKRMLKSLDLHYNQISVVGATKLISSLKSNSEIHTLDLSYNNIGAEGAKYVAHFLKNNASLQTLKIGNNSLKSGGAKYIADALKTNASLNALSISDNDIGDGGAKYIASALMHNETLTNLSLRKNNISDQGAKYIAKALKQNSHLEYLELSENSVGDDGAKRIGMVLGENQTLSNLVLECCPQIGDIGVNALADGIVKNKDITIVFDFSNPDLGDATKHLKKTPYMVYICPYTCRGASERSSAKENRNKSSRLRRSDYRRKAPQRSLEVKPTFGMEEIHENDDKVKEE